MQSKSEVKLPKPYPTKLKITFLRQCLLKYIIYTKKCTDHEISSTNLHNLHIHKYRLVNVQKTQYKGSHMALPVSLLPLPRVVSILTSITISWMLFL